MSDLQCEIVKIQNPEDPSVTVGERFLLKCAGDVASLDLKTAELRLDEAEKYKLKLLRAMKSSSSEIQLEVLSDLVGTHQMKALQLVDKQTSVVLAGFQFEVKSVQDPKSPVQEPFGSWGALTLSIPLLFWLLLVALLGSISAVVFWRIHQVRQRKKIMKSILGSASSTSAESELFQKIRKLRRLEPAQEQMSEVISDLEKSFQVFLSRHFEIPFIHWPLQKSMKALKSEQANFDREDYLFLQQVLKELEKAKSSQSTSADDFRQLLSWVNQSASSILQKNQVAAR